MCDWSVLSTWSGYWTAAGSSNPIPILRYQHEQIPAKGLYMYKRSFTYLCKRCTPSYDPYCVTNHSPFSYICWHLSLTRATQLEQARSPQLACKGSSKISQQNTHKKLWVWGPDGKRGGVNRLVFKNSALSANSVMTEQISSALTAFSKDRHLWAAQIPRIIEYSKDATMLNSKSQSPGHVILILMYRWYYNI